MVLFIIGAVLILGGIGSEEIGAIEFTQAIKQCLIGLPMVLMGCARYI